MAHMLCDVMMWSGQVTLQRAPACNTSRPWSRAHGRQHIWHPTAHILDFLWQPADEGEAAGQAMNQLKWHPRQTVALLPSSQNLDLCVGALNMQERLHGAGN